MNDVTNSSCCNNRINIDGTIYFSLGASCDNACIHCVAEHHTHEIFNERKDLSTYDVISYFDRIIKNKNVTIQISGGEPTLRHDFLYIMEYLATHAPNIEIILLTNGRSFSNLDFASKAAAYPPACIIVPLHADEPIRHDMITRRSGSFNETVLGIRNMLEYRMMVVPKIIVNKLNYEILPGFVEFVAQTFPECRTIGIDTMDVLGAAELNKESLKVKHTVSAPYIEKAIDAALKYGLYPNVIYMPFCLVNEKYWKYINVASSIVMYKGPRTETTDIIKARGIVEACGECRYTGRCPGTWFSYFREFGYDELKPVV